MGACVDLSFLYSRPIYFYDVCESLWWEEKRTTIKALCHFWVSVISWSTFLGLAWRDYKWHYLGLNGLRVLMVRNSAPLSLSIRPLLSPPLPLNPYAYLCQSIYHLCSHHPSLTPAITQPTASLWSFPSCAVRTSRPILRGISNLSRSRWERRCLSKRQLQFT